MKLLELSLKNFRNFSCYEFQPKENFNLILAPNGQGKTSLLEAIYLLGMGRSFRSNFHQPLIKYAEETCQVIGKFKNAEGLEFIVGVEKNQDPSKSQLKISGLQTHSTVEVAKLIPIQLVFHESFHLLDAGPHYRRKFIDWGVFYGEPLYFPAWQRFQYALKQRNALLKNPDPHQLNFWEQELATQAQALDQFRRMYLTLLLPTLEEVLNPLGLSEGLNMNYYAGWDLQQNYLHLLQQNRQRDTILGHTQLGPHRADLKIRIHQHEADHVLSRGQQKIFSFSMQVAQALLLSRLSQQQSLFLVDDLGAELDAMHIEKVLALLAQLPCQIFITTIHAQLFEPHVSNYNIALFPVEK